MPPKKLQTPRSAGKPLSLREKQKQQTHDSLVTAATDLFYRKGYTNTTIDDIVAGAHLSRATFYLHFQSKSDVILKIRDRMYNLLTKHYGSLSNLGEASQDDLAQWIDGYLDYCHKNRKTVFILMQTSMHEEAFSDSGIEFYQNQLEVLGQGIEMFARAASGRDSWARAEAFLILFQLESLPRYLLQKHPRLDQEALVNALSKNLYQFIHTQRS